MDISISEKVSIKDSVLYRWWAHACLVSWIIFITFEIALGCDKFYSSSPLCPYNDYHYGHIYWYICFGVLGGFLIVWTSLLTKVVQSAPGNERVPYFTAFNIVTMGTIATFLAVFDWGGVCIDVLGVASPAAIWGEWCACGPLLTFIVVTLDDKHQLSRTDWVLMISFFICLITGFFIIIPQSYALGVFWLTVSCVTYMPLVYLPWYSRRNSSAVTYFEVEEGETSAIEKYEEKCLKRFKLAMVLTIVLPLYTVNYIVAMCGGIDFAVTIEIYQVLSMLTKGLFTAVTMDIHFESLLNTKRALVALNERRANEARRAFLKYIFHEVRSPLNSLTIGIDILGKSTNLDPVDQESLSMMKDASEFMNDTLNDVLSMQKIEEGKLELDMAPFCINDAVTKVFVTLRGTTMQKHITLVKDVSDQVPSRVLGDRYRIEHVIANLLSNAIKFSPEHSQVAVSVSVVGDSEKRLVDGDETTQLLVSVRDEGPGISKEDQQKLFSNFMQIRPGQLQKGRGSGLGLALCKQVVVLHGGTIGVDSVEGLGSTFHFCIPFATCRLDTVAEEGVLAAGGSLVLSNDVAHSSHSDRSDSKVVSRKDLKVLIVDDAASNRKMLQMLLRKLDLQSDTAEDGVLAVEMVLRDPAAFHLVFMDNLMPTMSGVEATRQLRKGGYTHLVVGVTGNVLEDDLAEYLSAGADLILPKPLKLASLNMLFRFIGHHGFATREGMILVEHSNKLRWTPNPRQLLLKG